MIKNNKTTFSDEVLRKISLESKFNQTRAIYPKFDHKAKYKLSEEMFIPKMPGVYFVHDFRGFLYVGETKNLNKRFLQHIKREKNYDLTKLVNHSFGEVYFYWINTGTKLKAFKLQNYWIRTLKPYSNKIEYKQKEI